MYVTSLHPVQHASCVLHLPFYLSPISAGFPSPAESYIERPLDLNELLVSHPAATFFVRVQGESMRNAGICDGDLLIVDRSQTAKSGDIVIAMLHGEFTVKRWIRTHNRQLLRSENPEYPNIPLSPESDFMIWGVVTHAVHMLKPKEHVCTH